MKRLLCYASLILILLLLTSIAPPSKAVGESLVEVSANRTEATTGESITWTVSLSGAWGSTTCAYFLYCDMKLIDIQTGSTLPFYQYTPDAPGFYRLSVYASDGTKSLSGSAEGVPVNAPLGIVSVDANRPRISLGAVATWTARTEGGSGNAHFGFFVYRDGDLLELCMPDDPESGILNYTPEEPGTYTVDVLASDASGKAKMEGAPIVVSENAAEPLTVTSVFPNAYDLPLGREIVWTATASGGEESIAFSFFLYRDGELVSFTPMGTSSVYRLTPTEPGVYSVSVHVTSGLEFGNLKSGNVTIVQPEGVQLTSVDCDRNIAVLGEELTWTAQSGGALGEIAYSFALYRDWALMGLYETGDSPVFSFVPEEVGTYSVIVYAKDDVSAASAPSADVRVVSAELSVDSVTPDQLTGVVGKPITWTVHATGGENLRYVYFVYLNWELVYSSDITTESAFTYLPTGSDDFNRYYIEGFVSDGEQMVSFQSAVLPVAGEGKPRILSIVPDQTIAYPGEKITWTVAVDYNTDSSEPIGQIAFWLMLDQGETAIDYTEYARVASYAYVPTQPGTYRLIAAIDTGFNHQVCEAPVVQVVDPTMPYFDIAIEPNYLPDIIRSSETPTPTLSMSEIVVPHVDFSDVLATTRPPMAPEKPKPTPTPAPTIKLDLPKVRPNSTPTPAPTLNPDLPIFEMPDIHLP